MMSISVKMIQCALVFFQIICVFCQEPIPEQNNNRQYNVYKHTSFQYNPVHYDSMKRQMPNLPRIPPIPYQPLFNHITRIPWFNRALTTQNNRMKIKNDANRDDCTDQIDLNCEEQRKLIENVFRNYNPRILNRNNDDYKNHDIDTATKVDKETSGTTEDYETVTLEESELDDRIAPEVVASLLG